MKSDKLVIGDIHGMYSMLSALLKEWNPDTEQLIFLGDYIDRGSESKEVLELAVRLKEEYGAVLLKGNHEDMLLQWLDKPKELAHFYLSQGGFKTLESFSINSKYTFHKQAEILQSEYSELIDSIRHLELYSQDDDHIYVHAGVNPTVYSMEDMSESDLLWIREAFFYREHQVNKRVVFGHTPTRLINECGSNNIWISKDKSKLGIDGGAASGGNLIGLRIKDDSYETIYVNQNKSINSNRLYI